MTKTMIVVVAALALAACKDPTSEAADAAAPAASSSVAAAPSASVKGAPSARAPAPRADTQGAAVAANVADITRFPDEKPLPEIADHINWDMRVRKAPSTKDGDVIVALRAGTPVTKLAKRGQWFLITFADPAEKSRTLMGWTWEQAFFPLSGPGDAQKLCTCWKKEHPGEECDAVAGMAMGECDRTYGDDCPKLIACVHGQLPPKCMPNERLVMPQGVCARTCARNADCPNDQVCTEQLGDPHVCRPAKVLTDTTL